MEEWEEVCRKLLPRTMAARAAAAQAGPVSKHSFRPLACEEPFDAGVMADLTSAEPSFSNATPEVFRLHTVAWQLSLACGGDMDKILQECFPLMLDCGVLLKNQQTHQGGLVVHVCKYGVLIEEMFPFRDPLIATPLLSQFGPDGKAGEVRYMQVKPPLDEWSV